MGRPPHADQQDGTSTAPVFLAAILLFQQPQFLLNVFEQYVSRAQPNRQVLQSPSVVHQRDLDVRIDLRAIDGFHLVQVVLHKIEGNFGVFGGTWYRGLLC